MSQREPRRARVRVDGDDEEAAGPGRCERRGRACSEDEQLHRTAPFAGKAWSRQNEDVATALADRVEELKADHGHGASWMARRAVEALAVVAEASVAWELARAAHEKFGGDAIADFVAAWRAYVERISWKP